MGFVVIGDAAELYGQAEELVVALAFHRFASLAAEPFGDDGCVGDAFEGLRVFLLHHRFHRLTQIIYIFSFCMASEFKFISV